MNSAIMLFWMVKPMNKRNDFGEEYIGKRARILTSKAWIEGEVQEVRKYLIKLKEGRKVIYVHKAHIIQIEPIG